MGCRACESRYINIHVPTYLAARLEFGVGTYLEGLGIPIVDLLDRGHLTEPIGQGLELLHPVGESYGQLLGKELRGAEESAWAGSSQHWGRHGQMTLNAESTIQFRRLHNSPTEGLSPNWTICRKLTPVAGKLA